MPGGEGESKIHRLMYRFHHVVVLAECLRPLAITRYLARSCRRLPLGATSLHHGRLVHHPRPLRTLVVVAFMTTRRLLSTRSCCPSTRRRRQRRRRAPRLRSLRSLRDLSLTTSFPTCLTAAHPRRCTTRCRRCRKIRSRALTTLPPSRRACTGSAPTPASSRSTATTTTVPRLKLPSPRSPLARSSCDLRRRATGRLPSPLCATFLATWTTASSSSTRMTSIGSRGRRSNVATRVLSCVSGHTRLSSKLAWAGLPVGWVFFAVALHSRPGPTERTEKKKRTRPDATTLAWHDDYTCTGSVVLATLSSSPQSRREDTNLSPRPSLACTPTSHSHRPAGQPRRPRRTTAHAHPPPRKRALQRT
mmetsp:Transcript_7556/g.24175  ORF Transcript_7556/g.24175 Transcript_7556/m.24175 type:complete len:362 (-) Transcript_7556:256-1341(-)